jgi:glycosyltransferase involved in cell wall biosynthesis
MRIGIYDPYLDTMSGGEKYLLTAAKCLAKQHEVSLFWDPKQEEEIRNKAKTRFGFDLADVEFTQNIFTKSVFLPQRMIESRKYDYIIYLSDGSIPIVACPLIMHFQSPMLWLSSASLKTKIKLSLVQEVICNSYFTKSFIDKSLGCQSKVLYPPVEIKHTPLEVKEKVILNVGRFGINTAGSSFKKQDVMAEVFVRMNNHIELPWKLMFVMSVMDSDMAAANAFVRKYETYPIEFLINPGNNELWQAYKKASIYWHAAGYGENITDNPDRAEHFGISTVEAMGTGAVPVVINAGGQTEIVRQGEDGYLWDTEEELISRTLELMKNTQKRDYMAKSAQERAKDFREEVFCKKLAAFLP